MNGNEIAHMTRANLAFVQGQPTPVKRANDGKDRVVTVSNKDSLHLTASRIDVLVMYLYTQPLRSC